MPQILYYVKTQDVDHNGPARKYRTLEAAVARFMEMAGGSSIDNWIAEHYYALVDAGQPAPKIEEIKRLRAVSMFGTVVTFEKIEKSDEDLASEKEQRVWRAASRKAKADRKALMAEEKARRKANKAADAALEDFNYVGSRWHY